MSATYQNGKRQHDRRVVWAYNEAGLSRAIDYWRKQGWVHTSTTVNRKGMLLAPLDHIYIKELAK